MSAMEWVERAVRDQVLDSTPATAACDCNRAMMAALSPMHPFHYIELACDEHRREFQQASLADSIRDYEPHNGFYEVFADHGCDGDGRRVNDVDHGYLIDGKVVPPWEM